MRTATMKSRRWKPSLLVLEDRCVPAGVTTYADLVDAINAANIAFQVSPNNTFQTIEISNQAGGIQCLNPSSSYDQGNGPNFFPVIKGNIILQVEDFDTDNSKNNVARIWATGNTQFRFFEVDDGLLTINNFIAGGRLQLRGIQLDGGVTATDGGAVYVDDQFAGDTRIRFEATECTFTGNLANGNGGAVFTQGRTVLQRSAFDNTKLAVADRGNYAQQNGGAVWADHSIRIENSTFHRNGVGLVGPPLSTSAKGGAIYLEGPSLLNFCTISENSALSSASTGTGGGIFGVNGSIIIVNTVLYQNSADAVSLGFDLGGAINTIQDSHFVTERNQVSAPGVTPIVYSFTGTVATNVYEPNRIDAQLLPLANNGGRTKTRMPRSNSPLVDQAVMDPGLEVVTDQRGIGFPRPDIVTEAPDIGAVELQPDERTQLGNPWISITDGTEFFFQDGEFRQKRIKYRISIQNQNQQFINYAMVDVRFQDGAEAVTWWSSLENGAKGTPWGNGNINEVVMVLPNSIVTYYATVTIADDADRIVVRGELTSVPGLSNSALASGNGIVSDTNFPTAIESLANMRIEDDAILVGSDRGTKADVVAMDEKTGEPQFRFFPYGDFAGGVRVAKGDVTGDGVEDFVIAPGPGGGPHVKVYDGRTGYLYTQFFAYGANFAGGVNVAATDIDGDGRAEVITAPVGGGGPLIRQFWIPANNPRAVGLVGQFYAYATTFFGGVSLAAGDVNGDGRGDVVTGAGPGGGPHVRVFNGRTYSLLNEFYAYSGSYRGGVFVALGNVGAGGISIVTSPMSQGGPHVKVFNAISSIVTNQFFANDITFFGGIRIALADRDNDGIDDIVATPGPGRPTYGRTFNKNGQVVVLAGVPLVDLIPFKETTTTGGFNG